MLKQYSVTVTCLIDGRPKTFYYTVTEDRPARFGYRYGCSDKRPCAECSRCWKAVQADSSLQSRPLGHISSI